MTFADRITKAWGALTDAPKAMPAIETKASAAAAVAVHYKVGMAQWSPPDYRARIRAFADNPIVFRASMMIAEAVAEIEPYVMIGEEEDTSPANPVVRLLQRPNPESDRFAFIRSLVAYRKLHGNGFIELVTGLRDYPAEVWALRPDRMQIIPGPTGAPLAYRYEAFGRRKDWPVDVQIGISDLLHMREFNPLDDIWGQGCLSPAARAVDLHNAALTFQKSLLDNGGAPSGALKYAPQVPAGSAVPALTEAQREALKKSLDERVGGAKNAGKPLVLDGGLDWVQFGMTMVDMQAKETKDDAARMIALAFGVPPMLLGIPGDNTFSNYQEAAKAFFRQTVLPEARHVYGTLGRWIAVRSGLKNCKVMVDDDKVYALADDLRSKWERLTMQGVPLTLNELREAMGYDALAPDIGDEIYMDGFRAPLHPKIRTDEAAAGQAEVQLQQMMAFPGYDPAKDKDGDGQSGDGTGTQAGEKVAVSKIDGGLK